MIIKRTYLILCVICVLLLSFVAPEKKKLNIYLVGDSTMQTYREDETPMRGWGQYFHRFFTDDVQVHNKAIGGRSSRSFMEEGRWQAIVDQLKPGDWVFIQFGHNDGSSKPERYTAPEDYRKYLMRYVKESRAKKANPVLLTSISMRRFDENGHVVNGLGEYPAITREVAEELQVPLIDLNKKTAQHIGLLGEEAAKALYMWLEPGDHPKYPDGLQDNTHLREPGALEVAQMAAAEIRRQKIKPLKKYLKE